MAPRHRLRAWIGRIADMPVAGAGRIHDNIKTRPFGLRPQHGFGQRGATDIAEADEQDRRLRHSAAAVLRPSAGMPIERRPPKSVRATITPSFSIYSINRRTRPGELVP